MRTTTTASRGPGQGNDKSLSLKERYWDTTHDMFEDCGNGPEHIFINFRNPADIGFDPEKLKDFDGTIVCSGNEQSPTIMVPLPAPPPRDGCELRTRFWLGYIVRTASPIERDLLKVKLTSVLTESNP